MNKNEIKKLLMAMRTPDNETKINKLLGKIDLLSDEKIESMISQIGDNEESIKTYLQNKLKEDHNNTHEEHTPINEMFTYGVSKSSVHLHMPIALGQMFKDYGRHETIDMLNLHLLDAIERIRTMQREGYHKFNGIEKIYMISPLMIGKELDFLNELDFKTQRYTRKQLQDSEFVGNNPEAQLATHIFGTKRNVSTAVIGLDVVNSDKWQEKRKAKIKEFEAKGITLDTEEKSLNE